MSDVKKMYQDYVAKVRKIADITNTMALLHWDKEVYMPKKGAKLRGQQLTTLAGIAHELATSKELGNILHELDERKQALTPEEACNVRVSLEGYQRQQKYSGDFVKRQTQVTADAYEKWATARDANDYNLFKGALKELVNIAREEAEILGYEDHPYDALLDKYEKGARVKALDVLFEDVRQQMVDFCAEIQARPQVEDAFLKQHYDKNKQLDYGTHILKVLSYDFDAGRLDISRHPFTIHFGSNDVRVTTRIDEQDFCNMTWSTIHEAGHALYEQGLQEQYYGLPMGQYISLGIHESQSRLWENNVGRSLTFWQSQYAHLQSVFPEHLQDVSVEDFYKGINKVIPSFIRTESDELTYHFHILIRYELEKGLIEGAIEVDDLAELWNEKYKAYMNLDVPDANRGILQDIHWSHGSIGYFPTYSLGSFYAAQFYQQAEKDIPNLTASIESGNTLPLLEWLRSNIHEHGRFYTAEELCTKITGEPLNFKYFMDYARNKFGQIYNM